MLDFPLIDTHLHLWDPDQIRYPWLDDLPELNRPFVWADFEAATAGLHVEHVVFLQCEAEPAEYRKETAWVTSLAARDRRLAGIVTWAPVERGAAAREDYTWLAANPLVKGVRRIIQFEPDPAFCLRPAFVEGVRLLAEFDLHFELCLKGDEQFQHAVELVRRCPEVRFVLDHIGKPFIEDGMMSPWDEHLEALAALPNAWCKLSGVVTEASLSAWTLADVRQYIEHAIESFGWDRVMFGSDWPVVTRAGTYARWVETLAKSVKTASNHDVRKLFAENARAFYRLAV
jgi:L-fuconolactonase